MQWKQRYRWKQNRSTTRRNVRHFPSASGRMTPNSVCLWRYRKHGNSNKRWRQRRFEPSQETGVKKMKNGNVSSAFISLWFASVRSCKIYPKPPLASGLTLTKFTRTVTMHNIPLPNVTSGQPYTPAEVKILVREYPENYKNGNFKRHFLENGWLYRHEILHDNLEDQAKWHISKLCSFL